MAWLQKFFVRVFIKHEFANCGLEEEMCKAVDKLLGQHCNPDNARSPRGSADGAASRKRLRGVDRSGTKIAQPLSSIPDDAPLPADDLNSDDN